MDMFSRMRVVEAVCLLSLVMAMCSVPASAGSVTGTYYSTSVAATATLKGNGYGGPYAITADYADADTGGATGTTPVSSQIFVMACPDDYVWDGHDYTYPRASATATADFLSVGMDCGANDGLMGLDERCDTSATANGSASAHFLISQTDSWTLTLSGLGTGPWLTGDMGAELFDSNMSSLHRWTRTWSDDHTFRLSSTDTFASGTYYLYLWASGSACAIYGEPDSANVQITAQIQCVPAPGVLLLGGIGAGLAGALRKRRTR
jgi:hypothetical protein